MAVSGNLGGKVPVVDDVLSSHEQEIYPTASLDENCIEFEFETDQNYKVDLRQTYLASKLKFNSRSHETYYTEEVKKDHKEETKADETKADEETEEEEQQKVPVPPVTHKNNVLHSIFNVEVYLNNRQVYNSNALYAHNSYFSINFKGDVSEYKGVLQCKGYVYEEFSDEIMEAP